MDQIRREVQSRGLPELIDLEILADARSVAVRPADAEDTARISYTFGFELSRSYNEPKERIPDRFGQYMRIVFSEPVAGPIAFGYGCHYGLGLFRPEHTIED